MSIDDPSNNNNSMSVYVYDELSLEMPMRVVLMRWSRRRDPLLFETKNKDNWKICWKKKKIWKANCAVVYKERTTQKNKFFSHSSFVRCESLAICQNTEIMKTNSTPLSVFLTRFHWTREKQKTVNWLESWRHSINLLVCITNKGSSISFIDSLKTIMHFHVFFSSSFDYLFVRIDAS